MKLFTLYVITYTAVIAHLLPTTTIFFNYENNVYAVANKYLTIIDGWIFMHTLSCELCDARQSNRIYT